MRLFAIFSFFFFPCLGQAQPDPSFVKLLESTREITVQDSLEVQTANWDLIRLDSTDVKRFFSPILGSVTNNRLKNRSYYLTGKITSHPAFSIFLILEEKKKDTTVTRVLYLVTTKKEGKYISNLEAAVSGTKKKSNYDTYSYFYPGMVIRKHSSISVNHESMETKETYKIINSGRFVLSSED